MADSVGKLVLDVIKDNCEAASCPYRYGDNDSLPGLIDKKLKHRVSDGNELRVMKRRVKKLESAVNMALSASNRKLTAQEILHLKNAIKNEV